MCYLIYRKVNFIQKISWFSLNSWRIFFSGYRILGWQHISFNTWKMYYIPLAPIVSDEKLADIWIVFPLWIKYHYLFTSSLFSRFFFFVFSYQKIDCDISWPVFLWVCPIRNFLSFLNLYVFIFWKIWEIFTHFFFWMIFQFPVLYLMRI